MLPEWTAVGFTGHRELANPAAVAAGIRAALDRLAAAAGPLSAVGSVASGADTLFFEEAATRGMPLFVVLPFPIERFKADFSPTDWDRVTPLLARALRVDEVCDSSCGDEAYLEAGVTTVDRCDVLLAVWNGKPAAGVGGTAEIVEYARATGKPMVLIDPHTGSVSEERLETLPARAPAPALEQRDARAAVKALFDAEDARASTHGPQSRQMLLRIIVLHLVALAVALVPLTFDLHGLPAALAMAVKVLCLIAALVLAFRQRAAHHEWMHSRIAAELCRCFLAIWRLPRRTRPYPRRAPSGLERLYRNLQTAWYLDRSAGDGTQLPDARAAYVAERVEGQVDYFRDGAADAERIVKTAKRVATTATAGAIACGGLTLILSLMHRDDGGFYRTSKLLSLLLPLVSAGLLSWVVASDFARRAERYGQLAAALASAARRLATTRTWGGFTGAVADTEELLLHEVVEWHTVSRFAGESH
jgi:hypothetical protein